MFLLILEFYIPSLVITAIAVGIVSLLYMLIFRARNRNLPQGQMLTKIHEVVILDLLTIPVLSFVVLAIIVVLRAVAI